ncbi:hypothetical protein S40293_02493 [Stachybotrys chartarum IBT 40293]|nr:hypothetical protein S40293_02493 [Stachybotrys chartarum IBT 40293]KFA74871.1 hypothetical protein S40288_06478 [Stachybotrys chartarum IBT 40288]
MGQTCSRLQLHNHASPRRRPEPRTHSHPMASLSQGHARDVAAARRIVAVLDANANASDAGAGAKLAAAVPSTDTALSTPETTAEYFLLRQRLADRESRLDFDHPCRVAASPLEDRVDRIIQKLRQLDAEDVYGQAQLRRGHGGQLHPRFPGDHFLSNSELITQTRLFNVASMMPKGAHLHIHFNACLLPNVLLELAMTMERMFITSDLPLVPDNNYENFHKCEIQFSILSPDKEVPGNIFSHSYRPRQTMLFKEFLARFPPAVTGDRSPFDWLMNKLVFHEAEVHGAPQTAAGAWQKFNARTRMMKGLFNYESAYKRYTRLCLEDFVKDNIQYAEIRPNFMTSNQLCYDDGSGSIDNWGIMRIIIDEVEKFQLDMKRQGRFFGGLKVIYCTPRSFRPSDVKTSLLECIEFKKTWPDWIAGFDMVGEEAKGRPIKDFIPELLEFRRLCEESNLDIPFLFHCGETLDLGTDTDGNLLDALLLNSRRIGHGFALSKHPYVMQCMKARNICLEVCPISNEILGLTPRISGHSMYELLANNVHCTINSDNGTLFRSTLSHDLYQVMVGSANMSLYGWKQLILWSLEHSCLDGEALNIVLRAWEGLWQQFLERVVGTYETEISMKDESG